MKSYSDEQLVSIAQSCGDHAAFDELFKRHHQKLRRFLINKVNDALVDDVIQETYIKAYINIARFEGNASFSTWLFSIAINEYRQLVRKAGLFDKLRTLLFSQQSPLSGNNKIDIFIDFIKLADGLSDKQYEVYVLHAVYGYSHGEISTRLEMALGSVKTYLAQAQKILRADNHD